MKTKGFVRLTLIGGLFLTLLLLLTPAAKAQKTGAYYWGDGDGNGSIGGPDLNVLYAVIANGNVSDASEYTGYPQSRYRQDLDGNGSISGPDANVMYGWAAGNFSNRPGNPDRLLLNGTTNLSVNIGDSVTLQAYALSPVSIASALRTGLGVNFQITGGTCTTNAQIYGYNVAGGSTVNAWRNPSAYHYLPTRLAPDNGLVWVRARGNTCTDGQTTIIKVYIPSDAHSGASGSRFPNDLVAWLTPTNSTPVNFTITWHNTAYVTAITVNPASTSLANGSTTSFTATCTLSNGSTTNCTSNANTSWGDTGNLTQQSPPNRFLGSGAPCPAGGHGTPKATYNDGSHPQVSNTSSVTVTNALQSVSVNPTSAIERASVGYKLTGTCLVGTTGDVTAGSTISGNCSGSAGGPATMGWTCGNVKPPTDCTITKTAKTATITLNNDPSDAVIGAACTIAGTGVAEGSSAGLGCSYSWNNSEGNCNVTGWNANTDASITGSHCAKGVNDGICSEFNCDSSNWSCTIGWGATTTATRSYNCLNNDTVLSVSIKPDSTVVLPGVTVNFNTSSIISWTGNGTGSQGAANACTESACNKPAKVTWADPAGCGTLATSTCLWTAGSSACSERISLTDAHNGAITDGATAAVTACATKPIINNIFPLDFAARFKGNAHTDQIVTLLFNNTIISSSGCALSSVHMTCAGSDASNRTFTNSNCTLGSQDVPCTPPSNFNPLVTYSCTVTATNVAGSTVISTARTMTTATASAPASPAIGGLGGGYVGGNAYSHATGVASGTVTYQFVDMDTLTAVPGRAYVQILQGATISEWFTSTTGQLTATLPALPIKELTVGYKCGTMRCNLNTRSNNYQNYAYQTWENVDARDGVIRLTLMDNSQGFINVWNTTHQGRYRADVIGTINPANFSTFIAPIDRSDATQPRMGVLFAPPTKLRAGLFAFAMRNIYTMINVVTGLFTAGDSETSISICMATEANAKNQNYNKYGYAGISYVTTFALPPILAVPELVRSDWTNPCASFAANPGNYRFKVWNWIPGQTLPLMTLGVYANASNFSLAMLTSGLNLFVFPFYVSGVNYTKVPSLATWTNPTADTVVHTGQISFEGDMREIWVAPDYQSPGYDPDPGVDKRITVSIQPILPLDPMRRNAADSGARDWWVSAMVPNSSESQLTSKYATTYGVDPASWDDRFVRNDVLITSVGVTGFNTGIVLFGLQLNVRIDDQDFTTFEVGYLASEQIGTWSKKVGSSQLRYWNNSATDSKRTVREIAFMPSNYGDTSVIKWNQTVETGGNTNYVSLVAFVRGLSVTQPKTTPIGTDGLPDTDNGNAENLGLHSTAGTYAEDGFSLKVQHVGPIENYTTTITANGVTTKALFIERVMDLPEALKPAPDTYFYPAPQWGGTFQASAPFNRNGEMRHQFTYNTSGKWITRTGSGLNRRYFKFKVPGFAPTSPSDSPDYFMIDLSTKPHGPRSAKTGVNGTHGYIITGSPNIMNDSFAHFQTQGVVAGDSIYIWKGYTYTTPAVCTISAVVNQTQVQWNTACTGTLPTQLTYDRYYIKRNHGNGPVGECLIDQYYGGDAYRESGGGCSNLNFWHFLGPIPLAATSVEVDIPNITPGAATLNGVSGVIPDAWEGIPSNTLMNSVWWFPPRLAWDITVININSGSATVGGLGGPFNWNNQNFWLDDYATNMMSTDTHFFYINFAQ